MSQDKPFLKKGSSKKKLPKRDYKKKGAEMSFESLSSRDSDKIERKTNKRI